MNIRTRGPGRWAGWLAAWSLAPLLALAGCQSCGSQAPNCNVNAGIFDGLTDVDDCCTHNERIWDCWSTSATDYAMARPCPCEPCAKNRFRSPHSAAPIFIPPQPSPVPLTGSPQSQAEPANLPPGPQQSARPPLPPVEMFNNRPAWPVASGVDLGSVTFYRERYYDWQISSTAGRGYLNNYTRRQFESYRVGMFAR